jgi:putative transposase
MTDYRRNRVPGGSYFFTVNLVDRQADLLTRHIDILRHAVRKTRAKNPFHIDAWVVLPDHMHCIWTMPARDADFSSRWQSIKTEFSKQIPANESRSCSRTTKGERGIWQRRFWEHTIRDGRDYATHIDYIHFNPVKHNFVLAVAQWPHSSFHRCVTLGLYPASWACIPIDLTDAGEPRGD